MNNEKYFIKCAQEYCKSQFVKTPAAAASAINNFREADSFDEDYVRTWGAYAVYIYNGGESIDEL